MQQLRKYWPIRLGGPLAASTFAWLLLVGDLGYLLIHLSHRFLGFPSSRLYHIGQDLSHPEFYQYTKECWIALILLFVFWRSRKLIFLGWLVLFGFVLFDDALQLHERAGAMLVTMLGIPGVSLPGIGEVRGQDFGEVLGVLIFVLPVFACVGFGYLRASAVQREFSHGLIALIGLLGFFGVVVDFFVHADGGHTLFFIEDGGEMIVMTAILWFVFRYYITLPSDRPD